MVVGGGRRGERTKDLASFPSFKKSAGVGEVAQQT